MLPQLQIQHKQRLQVQTGAIPLKQLSKHLSSCTENSCLDALRLLQAGGTAAELMEQAMTKCPCFDPHLNRWSCSRCGTLIPDDSLHLHICTSAPAFLNAAMVNLGMAETGARPWLKRCRFCKQALRADPGSYHTCSAAVFSHSLFDLSCSRTHGRSSSSRSSGSEFGRLQDHQQQQLQPSLQELERAAKLRAEFIGHVASVFVCPQSSGSAFGSDMKPAADAGGYRQLPSQGIDSSSGEAGGLLFFNGMVASSSLGPAAGRGLYTVSRITTREPLHDLLNARMPRHTSCFVLPYKAATSSSANSANSTSSNSSDNSVAVLDQQQQQRQPEQEQLMRDCSSIMHGNTDSASPNSVGTAAMIQLHAQAGVSPVQDFSSPQQQQQQQQHSMQQQQQQPQPLSSRVDPLLTAGVAYWANQAHGHYANMYKHSFKQQQQQQQSNAWGGNAIFSQQQPSTFLVVKAAVAAGRELLFDYELQPCAATDTLSQLDCACPMPPLHKFCWSPESANTAAAPGAGAAAGLLPLPAVSHAAAAAAAMQGGSGAAALLGLAPVEIVGKQEPENSSSGARRRKQGRPQRSRFD